MSQIGYRKKGDAGPLYHPDRDYAYITPELMCGAVDRFAEALDNFPEEKAWCDEHGITKEQLAEAVMVFAQAQKDFINAAEPVPSFDAALTRYGFKLLRLPVRQFLFSTFGFIFCAAWFKAVRDVSIIGQESPAQDAMASFSAAAREFANQCGVRTPPDIDADVLWMQRDVLLRQVADLHAENALLRDHVNALTQRLSQPTTLLQKIWSLFLRKKDVHGQVQDVQGPGPVCHKSGQTC